MTHCNRNYDNDDETDELMRSGETDELMRSGETDVVNVAVDVGGDWIVVDRVATWLNMSG